MKSLWASQLSVAEWVALEGWSQTSNMKDCDWRKCYLYLWCLFSQWAAAALNQVPSHGAETHGCRDDGGDVLLHNFIPNPASDDEMPLKLTWQIIFTSSWVCSSQCCCFFMFNTFLLLLRGTWWWFGDVLVDIGHFSIIAFNYEILAITCPTKKNDQYQPNNLHHHKTIMIIIRGSFTHM